MILGFADKETEKIWNGTRSSKLPGDIQQRAFQKLRFLHAASILESLRFPPSNRLHPLKGDREGQWVIRINDQWRLCFRWEGGNAHDVKITDYH